MTTGSEAARLIGQLHARGWSDAQIGRAVGRNSSLIHQGATGRKPLNNLVPGLRALAEGTAPAPGPRERAPIVEAARRTTTSGGEAKVRRGVQKLPGNNVLVETRRGYKTIKQQLQAAARRGKQISFTMSFQTLKAYGKSTSGKSTSGRGEVHLYSKGGWSAARVLARLDELDYDQNPAQALTALAGDLPEVDEARGLSDITLLTFDPKGG
jgi:hypothetical protein